MSSATRDGLKTDGLYYPRRYLAAARTQECVVVDDSREIAPRYFCGPRQPTARRSTQEHRTVVAATCGGNDAVSLDEFFAGAGGHEEKIREAREGVKINKHDSCVVLCGHLRDQRTGGGVVDASPVRTVEGMRAGLAVLRPHRGACGIEGACNELLSDWRLAILKSTQLEESSFGVCAGSRGAVEDEFEGGRGFGGGHG